MGVRSRLPLISVAPMDVCCSLKPGADLIYLLMIFTVVIRRYSVSLSENAPLQLSETLEIVLEARYSLDTGRVRVWDSYGISSNMYNRYCGIVAGFRFPIMGLAIMGHSAPYPLHLNRSKGQTKNLTNINYPAHINVAIVGRMRHA